MTKKLCLTLGLLAWATSAWAQGSYTDHGNQTVTDHATGLMWDQRESSTMTWQAALAYCEGLSHAGQTDWRLPNTEELQSIADYAKTSDPSIDASAFPHGGIQGYWTSTSGALNTSNAWYVIFFNGYVNNVIKTGYNYVRCVR